MAQLDSLQVFGFLSVGIIAAAEIPYYIDIIKGKTKPQRVAMLIFAILSAIAFFGQLSEGATISLWFAVALLLNQMILFLLSFKYGMTGFSKLDKASLLLAGLILIGWYITKSAALALVLVVAVNTIAKVLVMVKVYKFPDTELTYAWIMFCIASIFAALSVGKLDWLLLLVPIQNAITVGTIASIIIVRKRRVLKLAD